MKKLNALIILDGFGIAEKGKENVSAINLQGTPNIDELKNKYPFTQIGASGMDVGLPSGQMGNSEVGHLNMGAGRIVYQELTRITKSIDDGDFFKNEEIMWAFNEAKKNNKKVHLLGLLSDGGVHSHIYHVKALIKEAKNMGVDKLFLHCFMDGRDVSPTSGQGFIEEIDKYTKEIGVGSIYSVMGRYYAMDRDNRWDRVKRAYDCMVNGVGLEYDSPTDICRTSYSKEVTDEFIEPSFVKGVNGTIEEGDSVIVYNFRPDRAREITKALTIQEDFNEFEHKKLNLNYVCFTEYKAEFTGLKIAFKKESLNNVFGEYVSKLGKKQLRIAETEKYAHVTFFFNGGREAKFDGEERELIPSPKVATYDLKPEMSAYEVCDKAVEWVNSGKLDFMILNFANCDMVGHTGVMEATKKAVKTVDECVGKLVNTILENGGQVIVTADHGNSDMLIDENGEPFTAHTTNPVPFIVASNEFKNYTLKSGGRLCDVIPTLLDMAGLEKPAEMTGESLISK